MKLGFTGTRHGCTPVQLAALRQHLESLKVTEFHHGRCVGADAQAHAIMLGRANIVLHPGNNSKRVVADCPGAYLEMPPKPPLDRNKVIVRCTKALVACPNGMEEESRSGTWATVRFARRMKRKITFVWPDGSITKE